VLAGVTHPFAAIVELPLGRALALPSPAVVFSNELFDAQPCHRLVRHDRRWREIGVALRAGSLQETLLAETTPEVCAVSSRLPASAPEGYRLDLPLAAEQLAIRIAGPPGRACWSRATTGSRGPN
jgi:SAM-dependent MidA family methyltransferase